MADESKWWPQIMGHVLRYGKTHSREVKRVRVGRLVFCVSGDYEPENYRAYEKRPSSALKPIYRGNDLEDCRGAIAEYFRTREMFPVDQNQERTSA